MNAFDHPEALRIQVFQHVEFEGLGHIETWARRAGHAVRFTKWFAGDAAPPVESFDLLIVLGGPMGVYDEAQLPWLAAEKIAIRQAIVGGAKVFGICLGAQLLADALGAKVRKNECAEMGWHPVRWTAEGKACGLVNEAEGESAIVFHWHGDTFELPEGATPIASSVGCANQGFLANDGRILAIQFHLEMTRVGIESLCHHCAKDLDAETDAPFVHSLDQMIAATRDHTIACIARLEQWLNQFVTV